MDTNAVSVEITTPKTTHHPRPAATGHKHKNENG